MFKKIIFLIFAFIIILAAIGSCGDDAKPTTQVVNQPVTQTAKEEKPDLELLESKKMNKDSLRYVVGKIKNNSNKQYSYVQVEINLYDNNDNQVGSTLANVNNLEPGGTWKFEALIFEEKATKYKIKEITGY